MRRFLAPILALTLIAGACGDDDAATTSTTTGTTVAETTTTMPEATTTTVPETTTTSSTLPASPVLARQGDENDTVAAIQFLLDCLGYGDLTIDGEFGAATTTAVKKAQEALGLEATGDPTEDLFAALWRTCTQARTIDPGEDPVTVIGYADPGAPEVFPIPLIFGSTLTVQVTSGEGVLVLVKTDDGTPLATVDGTSFPVPASGDYTIEVGAEGEPGMFTLEVGVASGEGAGDWIITTDGVSYKGTQFPLGTAAGPMITKIFEALGHGVRTDFDEFDTGWDDPAQPGFRGILIEGMAFLFFGPTPADPGIPETFGRFRYVGPSFDKDGNPRPAGYVQTLSGITVGNTLADLKETYGSNVKPGSDTVGHYYRYASSGKEVCFYFGKTAPTDATQIVEISTQCRG